MKKFILLSTICLLSSIAAFSQSKQESIKELIQTMQVEETINKMVFPKMGMQQDSLSKALYQEIMNLTKPMISKVVNEDMVTLYDKYYTQKEIDDMIRFYKTETGKKMIEKSPDIQNEMMVIMQTKFMPKMNKVIKEHTERMMQAKSLQNATSTAAPAQ
ncbi:DUF2059 domain-containing protein [uncultured Bacteroides sp.]|uniref:DUF2059 domain-containing protein n=1 Tax=uncultured Bacteroides sp. TaxID=162156 RepID=UPI002AABEF74|nr:DUF2059 domain-containing protein [uncultured Bacteroides sp.]